MVSLDPGIKFCTDKPLGIFLHRTDLSPILVPFRSLALEKDPEAGLAIRPLLGHRYCSCKENFIVERQLQKTACLALLPARQFVYNFSIQISPWKAFKYAKAEFGTVLSWQLIKAKKETHYRPCLKAISPSLLTYADQKLANYDVQMK